MKRLQEQFERAFQRDRLVEGERNGRVAADCLLIEAHHVEMNRHVGLPGQGVNHRRERLGPVRWLHRRLEFLVDRDLDGTGPRPALRESLRPRLGQVLPVLRVRKLDGTCEWCGRTLDVLGHVEEACLTFPVDRPLGVESADHPTLCEQLPHDGVVGRELPGLLRDRLGLWKSSLVDECVVFLDEHGDPLVDLDPLGSVPVDPGLDLGVLLVEGEFGTPLARRLLDIAPRALDAAEHLRFGLLRQRLPVEALRRGIEEIEGVRR